MLYEYSGTVVSDLNSIKYCLDEILQDIGEVIDNEDLIFDLRLILNELVINSAIHGNNLEATKVIKIDINLDDQKFNIVIEDEGQGIEYDLEDYDYKNMKCCGRGLLIVNNLCDTCVIDKNRVTVSKKIDSL